MKISASPSYLRARAPCLDGYCILDAGRGVRKVYIRPVTIRIYRATLPDVRAAQTRAPSLKSIHIALPSYPPPPLHHTTLFFIGGK